MLKFILMIFLVTSLFSGEIKIAVAANVSYAIKPLIKAFNQVHPKTKVQVTLGSSGKLSAQIQHGAPYDLFMSANMLYPQRLYHDRVARSKPQVYAQGKLAFLSVKPQDFSQGMVLLKNPKIQKIALANPKTAPYGIAAKEALQTKGLYRFLKPKFVYGESISQTLSFTLHAADIGLVAKSALFSPKMTRFKQGKHWAEVDSTFYKPIQQGVVLLKSDGCLTEVEAFYDFLFSKSAKEVFEKYGYTVP